MKWLGWIRPRTDEHSCPPEWSANSKRRIDGQYSNCHLGRKNVHSLSCLPFGEGCSIELSLRLSTTWYFDSRDQGERLIAIPFSYKPGIRKGCRNEAESYPGLIHPHISTTSFSSEAILIRLLVFVACVLFQRRAVCGLLEVLSTCLADDGLCCSI
jgi:hypothetical protein